MLRWMDALMDGWMDTLTDISGSTDGYTFKKKDE